MVASPVPWMPLTRRIVNATFPDGFTIVTFGVTCTFTTGDTFTTGAAFGVGVPDPALATGGVGGVGVCAEASAVASALALATADTSGAFADVCVSVKGKSVMISPSCETLAINLKDELAGIANVTSPENELNQ